MAEPTIVVSAPKTVSGKNQNNVTVATFTHASGVEPASAFVATINWGDSSTSTGTITQSGTTYTVKGSHTYSPERLSHRDDHGRGVRQLAECCSDEFLHERRGCGIDRRRRQAIPPQPRQTAALV